MADLTITAADVSIVESREMFDVPAGTAITAGQAVRIDHTTGCAQLADATGTAAGTVNDVVGIAMNSAAASMTVTVLKKGLADIGDALGDLGYDAKVYLSDTAGALADGTGSQTVVVGRVQPIHNNTTGADKVLRLDL